MTYRATPRRHGDATVVRTLVSAVAAGDADGRLRFMDLPEPAGGPAVAVAGNPVVTAGGSFFLDVATGGAADKLLVSIGGESFGYYEIDLDDAAATGASPDRAAPVRPRPGPRSVLPAGDGGG